MTAVEGSILGNAVLRREDPTLLTGEDKFYDDMAIEGLGYVHFVRSDYAHARINSIDTSDAEAVEGVVGVWTADTLDMPSFQGFAMFPETLNRPPLAKGKVRFVGDIVAVVVADNRSAAADAAELVFVDYEPLPVVVDIEAALEDGAPILFEEYGSNMSFETAIETEGDPLAGADHVTEARVVSQRLAGVPIEPNGAVVVPDGDKITCYFSSQTPISLREPVAGLLGIDQENVRIVAPAVGGGFGPKAGLYAEHLITASGRPQCGSSGEVDRGTQREHELDGAGSGHDPHRQDGPHQRRQDHRRRCRCRGRCRGLPRHRRHPDAVHPDHDPGGLRHPRREVQRRLARSPTPPRSAPIAALVAPRQPR